MSASGRASVATTDRAWLVTAGCWMGVVVLALLLLAADTPVIATPHVPFVVLAGLFFAAESDALMATGDRRFGVAPFSAIALLIGLDLALPLEVLAAQQLGVATGWTLHLRRNARRAAEVVATTGLATAIGVWAHAQLVDRPTPLGPAGWGDGVTVAILVVVVGFVLSFATSGDPLVATLRRQRGAIVTSLVAIGTALVVVDVIRIEHGAASLLVVPAAAALLIRRRYAAAARRAASLAEVQATVERLHHLTERDQQLETVADDLRILLRADAVRVRLRDEEDLVCLRIDPSGRAWEHRELTSDDRRHWRTLDTGDLIVARQRETFGAGRRRGWRTLGPVRHESLTVPLVERGEVVGDLEVAQRRGSRRFPRSEQRTLRELATAVGTVLEAAHERDLLVAQHEIDSEAVLTLDRRNRELVRAVQARTVSLSVTSHELRTPLTALLAGSEMLERLAGDPDHVAATRRLAADLGENTRLLIRLVDDLHDMTRIEAGQLELHAEELDLAVIARQVVGSLLPVASAEGLRLDVVAPPMVPAVGDRARLWQILGNLIQNAITATSSPGSVRVRVVASPDGPVVRVVDTGPGIAPDDLGRYLAAFEQGPGARRGLGLGLPITRHLVERHRGTLTLASRVGRGTCVTVRLPGPGPHRNTRPAVIDLTGIGVAAGDAVEELPGDAGHSSATGRAHTTSR